MPKPRMVVPSGCPMELAGGGFADIGSARNDEAMALGTDLAGSMKPSVRSKSKERKKNWLDSGTASEDQQIGEKKELAGYSGSEPPLSNDMQKPNPQDSSVIGSILGKMVAGAAPEKIQNSIGGAIKGPVFTDIVASMKNIEGGEVATREPGSKFPQVPGAAGSLFPQPTAESNLSYFTKCSNQSGPMKSSDVLNFLQEQGLQLQDTRIKTEVGKLKSWEVVTEDRATTLLGNSLLRKALKQEMAIKNFKVFTESFDEIFHKVRENLGGHVATYIPQLANQNPNYWAAAVCSIDGQRYGIGDVDVPFCVQSTSKPITYCLALEINGENRVHQHVGREPSGRNFNDRVLMQRKGLPSIPHNPYINAGAIMTASLLKMDANEWDRYKYMMGIWQKLSGGTQPSFQNDTFMGERATASRNFCLAYMMEEEQAFPSGTNLIKTLEAYFTWCSIEITSRSMAMLAATLANGGICPTTTERIFTHQTVTNCLSLMMSCGMYDYSGRFAFEIGFPAKSGVSGVLCVVIPGVCGIATFSPRLDNLGNSVRGIDFAKRLSQRFPYHVFSQRRKAEHGGGKLKNLLSRHSKTPGSLERKGSNSESLQGNSEDKEKLASSFWWSAARGDQQRVRQLAVRGIDVNISDYDGRTGLHLAASEGHQSLVRLMVSLNANVNAKDHHGNTPMMDAIREHRNAAKRTLQLAARNDFSKLGTSDGTLHNAKGRDLFTYFKGHGIIQNRTESDGLESCPFKILIETLNSYGINTDADPRFAFLESMPDPFTREHLEQAARQEPVLEMALTGKLCVPNFSLLCEKFEELFSQMTQEKDENGDSHRESHRPGASNEEKEALNVMTIHGQRLHLGPTDQYLCAGDLISVALFAVSMELLGLDAVMEFVGTEPSGVKSCKPVLNSENLPYNPFMWNGVLALCSLLEERCGDAVEIVSEHWAKLCGCVGDCPMQYDEVFEEEDKRKNNYRVNALVYKSLDLKKFPAVTPPNIVVSTFFRLRAIKTSTTDLGSIAAVLANGGVHPNTNESVFTPETVKCVLSMMYSAGCEAQSGELSFKVGAPLKSSSEGAVFIVLPNIMGVCVVSPEVQENGVSCGGSKFCIDLGRDFNCHVLAGSSTSSAKQDASLYHFQTDMELCNQLLFAAESGDIMTLSQLHQLGFSLDYTDYDYRSAAHVAASNGRVKVLKYLNKKGADMNVRDRWGVSPTDDATRKGHHKAAATLRDMLRDDNYEVSDVGSYMSTVSARAGLDSRNTKSERTGVSVAAKMGMNSAFTIDEEDEEEDDHEEENGGAGNSGDYEQDDQAGQSDCGSA